LESGDVITECSKDNLHKVFGLVKKLENEVPFCKPDINHFVKSWSTMIDSGCGVIFIDTENDNINGFFSGLISQEINSGVVVAVESLWFVEPEKRKRGIGKGLLVNFERWAEQKSAKYICTAKPFKKLLVDKYRSIETFFVKEI
jgi:hypothetical protein